MQQTHVLLNIIARPGRHPVYVFLDVLARPQSDKDGYDCHGSTRKNTEE
jgi:N-acyl-D-aspartate/D-glutamate deacylase